MTAANASSSLRAGTHVRASSRLLRSMLVQLPLVVAAVVTHGGCIVTSTPTFTEGADCPPYFLANDAIPPTSKVTVIDLTSTSPSFTAKVPLRSCALTKTFEAHLFLDGLQLPSFAFQENGTDQRIQSITIPIDANVQGGCHLVELFVSSAFAPGQPRVPLVQTDLAFASWLIDVPGSGDHAVADCPSPTPP